MFPAMFANMFPRRTRRWFRQAVCCGVVVGVVLVLFGGSAQGAEGTWNVPGGGAWDDPANWLGRVPNGPGDVALFDVLQPTDSAIVTLNSPITVGGIDQANPNRLEIGGSQPLSLDDAGSGGVVRIRLADGAGDLAIGAPVTLFDDDLIASIVPEDSWLDLPRFASSGSSNLTKDGAGGLILGGNNPAWTGLITVDEGTLRVRSNAALGAGSGTDADATTVQAAGTLLINSGRTIAGEKIRLAGGTLAGGTLTGDPAGTTTIGGPIELLADSVLTNLDPDGKLKLTGAVSGPGGAVVGQGTVDLWGPLSFAGPLWVQGGTAKVRAASTHGGSEVGPGGHLLVTKIGSLVGAGQTTIRAGGELRVVKPAGNDPATSSVAPGSVLLDGGMLTLANGDFDPANLLAPASTGGVVALENVPIFTAGGTSVIDFDWAGGQIRLGAKTDAVVPSSVALLPDSTTHAVRFGGAPAMLTVETVIEDADGTPTNVDQALDGTTVLAAANTYTGSTTVGGGTLVVGHPEALGATSSVTVNDGALEFRASSAVPVEVHGGTVRGFDNVRIGPVEVNGSATIGGTDFTLDGGTTGTGDLVLEPSGLLDIETAPLAHDGETIIRGDGKVKLRFSGALGGGRVTIDGGRLRLVYEGVVPETVGRLALRNEGSLEQKVGAPGIAVSDFIAESGTVSAKLTGATELTKTGSGTVVLSGDNDYTGLTTVTEGTLVVEHANALGSGSGTDADATTVNENGTLLIKLSAQIAAEKIRLNGGTILGPRASRLVNTLGGPIELLADSTISQYGEDSSLSFDPTVISGPVSGAGALTLDGEFLLTGDSSYTSETLIQGDRTEVGLESVTGLGSPQEGTTIVDRAQLGLRAPTSEPLTIDGGRVWWQNGSAGYDGSVTLRRGTVLLQGAGPFDFPITLAVDPTGSDEAVLSTYYGRTISWKGQLVGEGDLSLFGAIVIDGTLAHNGDLRIDARDSIALNGANTYTGRTRIVRGKLVVNDAQALGTSTTPILVDDYGTPAYKTATLWLKQVVDRDIDIIDGTVRIEDAARPYEGTIRFWKGDIFATGATIAGDVVLESSDNSMSVRTIVDGEWNGSIRGQGSLSLSPNNTLEINGDNTYRGITVVRGRFVRLNSPTALGHDADGTVFDNGGGTAELNASTTEPLLLQDHSRLRLNAQLPRLPSFDPAATGSTIEVNVPSQYSRLIDLIGGALEINADTTLGALVLRQGGALKVADGAQATMAVSELEIRGGTLQGNVTGLRRIHKISPDTGQIRDLAGFDGRILVDQGTLVLSNVTGPGSESDAGGTAARSTSGGTVELTNVRGSAIRVEGEVDLDIALNNAHGINNEGALSGPGTIRGRVDLGDVGAYVGGSGTMLIMDGPVVGGSLTIPASGTIKLTSDQSSYVGETLVRRGSLELAKNGTLTSTSRIVVDMGGRLILNNSEAELPGQPPIVLDDRIADTIPVILQGAELGLQAPYDRNARESFDSLTLGPGHSRIFGWSPLFGSDVPKTELTVGSLSREPGATLQVDLRGPIVARLEGPPALDDGILGGWMTVWNRVPGMPEQSDFATHGPSGIAPLTEFQHDLGAAGASDNVLVDELTGPLNDDKIVNSLTIERPSGVGGSQDNVVDLGGNRLTVDSGGVLLRSGAISNGQLSVGADSPGELFLMGNGAVDAEITDGSGGPLAVVVAPAGFRGVVRLGGNNSYSGSTIVNGKQTAIFEAPAALPDGTDLVINGGEVQVNLEAAESKQLGTLTMRGAGQLREFWWTNQGSLDFEMLNLEDGTIEDVKLVGDGALTKITDGTVLIKTRNPDFNGNVEVLEGTLDLRGQDALGTAPITVRGGRLFWEGIIGRNASVTLAGGELAIGQEFNGAITVASASRIVGTTASTLTDSVTISGPGPLTFSTEGGFLMIQSENSSYAGEVVIEGIIIPQHRLALGTGPITVRLGGTLDVAEFPGDLPNDVVLAGGTLTSAMWSRSPPGSRLVGPVVAQTDSFIRTDSQDPVVLAGGLRLADDVRLTKTGEGLMHVSGELLVGRDTQLVAGPGFARFTTSSQIADDTISQVWVTGTIVADAVDASIDFVRSGFDELVLDASIAIPAGRSLLITEDGVPLSLVVSGLDKSLAGSGLLRNSIELRDGAAILPGASAGSLTIDGDATIAEDGRLVIELGGTVFGDQYDSLGVTGVATLGGLLDVALIDGFVPSEQDGFLLLSAERIEGVFANAAESIMVGEVELPVTYRETMVILGNASVIPEPSSLLLLAVGAALVCCRPVRRRFA